LRFKRENHHGGYENHTTEPSACWGMYRNFPTLYTMLTVSNIWTLSPGPSGWKAGRKGRRPCFAALSWTIKNEAWERIYKGCSRRSVFDVRFWPDPKAVILSNHWSGIDPPGIAKENADRRAVGEGLRVLISTHMIESMEENWDVITSCQGRIARPCRPGVSAAKAWRMLFSINGGR
jgi:hypothetical protein